MLDVLYKHSSQKDNGIAVESSFLPLRVEVMDDIEDSRMIGALGVAQRAMMLDDYKAEYPIDQHQNESPVAVTFTHHDPAVSTAVRSYFSDKSAE